MAIQIPTVFVGGKFQNLAAGDSIGQIQLAYGALGTHGIAGGGWVGIGAAPQPGQALYVQTPTGDIHLGDEQWAIGGASTVTPSIAPTLPNTSNFGCVFNGIWTSNINDGGNGQTYGGQAVGLFSGNSSGRLGNAYGWDAAMEVTGQGILGTGYGVFSHVENLSTGTITKAVSLLANVVNIGGGTVTRAEGLHVNTLQGTTTYGVYTDDQQDYAIYTNLGKVHFGGVMDVANATIGTLAGVVNFSDATATGININGVSGQSPNLFQIKVGATIKLSVSNGGGLTLLDTDTQMGTGTTIFNGSTQSIRISNSINIAGVPGGGQGKISWSGTTHAYDAQSVGIQFNAAGRLEVNNGTLGTFADLVVRNQIFAGQAQNVAGIGTLGVVLSYRASSITDTTGSGTVASSYISALGVPTILASSAVAYTDLANLFVAGPVASTNVTITNAWAAIFGGAVKITGKLAANGTATNDNASAGQIGEEIKAVVAVGSAVALTTATPADITSISLTAGDWDVSGIVDYVATAATTTGFQSGVSTSTGAFGGQDTYVNMPFAASALTDTYGQVIRTQRLSLSGTTTVYLEAQAKFTLGTVSGYGTIRARRVR